MRRAYFKNNWIAALVVAPQLLILFVFFLAALQSIPRSLIEAGAMDGAGVLRRMRDIQLPLLAPTFFFILVINITDSFTDSFGIIDTLTGGGPARATDLMVYKIYSDGFRGFDYSGAATQSDYSDALGHRAYLCAVPLHRAARALYLKGRDHD